MGAQQIHRTCVHYRVSQFARRTIFIVGLSSNLLDLFKDLGSQYTKLHYNQHFNYNKLVMRLAMLYSATGKQSMAIYGYISLYIAIYGYISLYMAIYRYILSNP